MNDINRLAELETKYKKLQDSKQQLFNNNNEENNRPESVNVTQETMRGWQATIKQMISSGQLTAQQEEIF